MNFNTCLNVAILGIFGKMIKLCCPGTFLLMNFNTDLLILVGIFGKMIKVYAVLANEFLLMTYLVI